MPPNPPRHDFIAGLDEVGTGALAGPMLVVAVAFPAGMPPNQNFRDSKALSPAQRQHLSQRIDEQAAFIGVGFGSPAVIDKLGMTEAWQLAASMALDCLPASCRLIVDGDRKVSSFAGVQTVVPKADRDHWQVSAASIIAKVLRDTEMVRLHDYYADYKWDQNMGYGTLAHELGLLRRGPSVQHRRLFLRKYPEKWRGRGEASKAIRALEEWLEG